MTTVRAIWIIGALSLLAGSSFAAEAALTIYNQNFAVVREVIPLDLKAGVNQIRFTDTTSYLEPGSVILRDRAGKQALVILEQNYRADPVSQELLLSLNEGQTISFLVQRGDQTEIVLGKIVRSGFVSRAATIWVQGQYPYNPPQPLQPPNQQPIVEVDGKLRFGLPGTPHSSGSHVSGGVRHFEGGHFPGPHHFHSGPRVFIGGAFFAPYYYPPYYYDPYYAPPPVEYVQPAPQQYWYYCGSARAYYTYVQSCP